MAFICTPILSVCVIDCIGIFYAHIGYVCVHKILTMHGD